MLQQFTTEREQRKDPKHKCILYIQTYVWLHMSTCMYLQQGTSSSSVAASVGNMFVDGSYDLFCHDAHSFSLGSLSRATSSKLDWFDWCCMWIMPGCCLLSCRRHCCFCCSFSLELLFFCLLHDVRFVVFIWCTTPCRLYRASRTMPILTTLLFIPLILWVGNFFGGMQRLQQLWH